MSGARLEAVDGDCNGTFTTPGTSISQSNLFGEGGEVMPTTVETLESSVHDASTMLKAMGNPHRLIILCRLSEGPCSVGELEPVVGLSQSALSQHLARLRRDALVCTRRDAQTIFYSIADPKVATLIEVLCKLYPQGKAAMGQKLNQA